MNTLRFIQAVALLALSMGSGIAAAAPSETARSTGVASGEVKLPQVIVIGKRLSAAEKARMAQEERKLENRRIHSRRAPRKTVKLVHNVS